MERVGKTLARIAVAVTVVASLSCGSDITNSASPVDFIAFGTQKIFRVDLETGCTGDIGTTTFEVRLKNPATNTSQQFNDVRITRYRVSYVRTDGGTAVPAPFVLSYDALVLATGAPTPSGAPIEVIQSPEILNQAPFASLLPVNGGRDPETGSTVINMDVIIQYFGQTLAGVNVSASERFPLQFCFHCGGCQ